MYDDILYSKQQKEALTLVDWFSKAPRGRILSTRDFKITFTDAPKGVRLNVALTRHLADTQYVKIGLKDNLFVIMPTTDEEDFKLINNKSSAQVCAAAVGEWAQAQGYAKKRISGVWDEEEQAYVFDTGNLEEDTEEEVV